MSCRWGGASSLTWSTGFSHVFIWILLSPVPILLAGPLTRAPAGSALATRVVCEGELNRTSLIRVGQHPAGRTCYQSAPKRVLGSQMSLLKFIDLAKSFMFCPLSSRSRLQMHTPWFSYAHRMQIPIRRAIAVLVSDGYRLCAVASGIIL